jgi:hypothetical protein
MQRRHTGRSDWSLHATLGAWSAPASYGTGREWDLAYGVRAAGELPGGIAVEVFGLRSGTSSGTPYASTSTSRTLIGAHGGYWLYDEDGLLAVQAGGGLALSLASSDYALHDVGGDPGSLSGGSAMQLAPEIGATLRVRPMRFLEARLDLSAIFLDGRLQYLAGLGVGFWVAF